MTTAFFFKGTLDNLATDLVQRCKIKKLLEILEENDILKNQWRYKS